MLLFLLVLVPRGVFAQVPYERLVRAESESGNWLTYSGSYRSQRFSSLKQITPENVAKLKPVWVYQIREPGLIETSSHGNQILRGFVTLKIDWTPKQQVSK